ncbi:uncharacterized protein [Rutidosis leptorrhynchoides]|uniref:uncharacterized protein n=1 Tax=Rutidosis leptorrhynchoides TaxID=125765 RepID=UPI003A991E58
MSDSNKIPLSEECTALLRDSLPMKLRDTGRFTFPCSIYQSRTIHALADLGASINLIPYSLFKRLELGDLLPTKMTIQLADHTIRYPKGIVENVLVKVDRFLYHMDFVVMDIKKDLDTPSVLGRPSRITSDDESPPSADTEMSITPPEPPSDKDPDMEEEVPEE